MTEASLTPEQQKDLDNAFLEAMASPDPEKHKEAVDAVTDFIRLQLRYIEHIPNRYFLHPANEKALSRLYKELGEKGQIELGEKGVPKCLLDEGIDSVEEGDPRWKDPVT